MDIEVCRHFYDVPCARLPIVGEVHVVLVVEQTQANLVSGEGPGPELHDTGLLVKREVRHVYCAGRLKNKKRCQNVHRHHLRQKIFKDKSSKFIPPEASRYPCDNKFDFQIQLLSRSVFTNKMFGKNEKV